MNIFMNPDENRLRAGWRLLVQFILMFILVGLGMSALQFLPDISTRLSNVAVMFLGTVLSILIAARLLDRRSFEAYGLQIDKNWWFECGAGILIGILAVAVVFLLEWSCNLLSVTGYGWERPSDTPFLLLLAGYLLSMLLVGFYEELFSRGYQILNLTEGLRLKRLGIDTPVAVLLAVIITSSLFGLLHAGNPHATVLSTFNIVLAGVVLAVPFLLTGRLAISAGLHFSWNFAQGGIFGFPVSGTGFRTSLLQIEQRGSELWTGGAFGPEAGISGILGMILMTILIIIYIRRKNYGLDIHATFRKEFRPDGKSDEQGP